MIAKYLASERQSSCRKVEKEKEKHRIEKEKLRAHKLKETLKISLNSLATLRERLLLEKDNLEGALQEMGRIIQVNKNNGGWVAWVEPWEEMRLRNNQRQGKPPIMVYQVQTEAMGKKLKISINKLQGKTLGHAGYPETQKSVVIDLSMFCITQKNSCFQ